MADLLTWQKVEKWIDALIEAEVEALAKAPGDQRLYWSQGRLQALKQVKRAPEAIAAMEGERDGAAQSGTARRRWEPWVVEPGDPARGAAG